jgi:NADH:ubiquinone oxidoreductase subunit F (NADH-binding)
MTAAPAGLPRLLASVRDDGRPVSLDDHAAHYGAIGDGVSADTLVEVVEAGGLCGRGGAAFPSWTKLRAVSSSKGQPVVVVNGVEAEPASGKDKALLRAAPHLVLDGAVLAAKAVGAREVIVAVGARATIERKILDAALHERSRGRYDEGISVRAAVAPDAFVSGEETALIQFLNGGFARPTFTPPRPFESGVRGAPTLVQNVETLAHLALLARFGAEWFRELGPETEPGTMLVTVSGAVARPGVHEIEVGTSLSDLLDQAGGATERLSAYLVGGYSGAWFDEDAGHGLRLDHRHLAQRGGALGAGVIVALPANTCALAEVARVAAYLAEESAGQCGPCVHGLEAIATAVARIAEGTADDRQRLARWTAQVAGRGACSHPDGATRFVASALHVFADEIAHHLRYGRCRAPDRRILPAPATRREAA